eukprot:GHVO01053562.1.p1 GENE.GHVO01053562.1~~GHVO01053562.1.p1  ORF type:complete len:505 (-),score=20.07 GHVO01053562.1:104-1618(-)
MTITTKDPQQICINEVPVSTYLVALPPDRTIAVIGLQPLRQMGLLQNWPQVNAASTIPQRTPIPYDIRWKSEPSFRMSSRLRDEVTTHLANIELETLCKKGVLRMTDATEEVRCISPIHIVYKSEERVRITGDFRRLNEYIYVPPWKDNPLLERLLHLPHPKYFCRIDLTNAFFSVPLSPHDRSFLHIAFDNRTYQHLTLPQGLSISPYIFSLRLHQLINHIPNTTQWVDDVLISGLTEDEVHQTTQKCISTIATQFDINYQKSDLVPQPETDFCGFRLNANGIRTLYANLPPQLPDTITLTTARSLLGYFNLFISFVPDLSAKTSPIRDIIKDKTARKQEIYNQNRPYLKTLLDECSNHLALAYFLPNAPIEVYTDFSEQGFGYIICQNNQPRFQGSKATAPTDKSLATWEGELLSIHLVVDRLSGYRTPGQLITWKTDSKILVNWRTIKTSETRRPKVLQALQLIALYQIHVQHIEGACNPADYLSRYPNEAEIILPQAPYT